MLDRIGYKGSKGGGGSSAPTAVSGGTSLFSGEDSRQKSDVLLARFALDTGFATQEAYAFVRAVRDPRVLAHGAAF